jgi:hypothetical protein
MRAEGFEPPVFINIDFQDQLHRPLGHTPKMIEKGFAPFLKGHEPFVLLLHYSTT